MTEEEAIFRLGELALPGFNDPEADHGNADDIVVEFLRAVAPKVAAAYEGVQEGDGGWWYA